MLAKIFEEFFEHKTPMSIKLQHALSQPDDLLPHLQRVENFDFGAEAEQVATCLVFDPGPARIVLPPSTF
jgi:hypothetical protein